MKKTTLFVILYCYKNSKVKEIYGYYMSNTTVPNSWQGLSVDPKFAEKPAVAITEPVEKPKRKITILKPKTDTYKGGKRSKRKSRRKRSRRKL